MCYSKYIIQRDTSVSLIFTKDTYNKESIMYKHNGLIYLDEYEWDDEALREKYPDALLGKFYCKNYGHGKMQHTNKFMCTGLNRRQRRHGSQYR